MVVKREFKQHHHGPVHREERAMGPWGTAPRRRSQGRRSSWILEEDEGDAEGSQEDAPKPPVARDRARRLPPAGTLLVGVQHLGKRQKGNDAKQRRCRCVPGEQPEEAARRNEPCGRGTECKARVQRHPVKPSRR